MSKTSINGLAAAVMEALHDYAEVTEDVMRDAVVKVSKETKKIAESGSPVKTGAYKSGWTVRKTEDKSGKLTITVHNRRKPSLTHLLEKGHAKRGGGRVEGKPHIAPAEQYAIERLEAEIRKGLGG